MSAATKLVIALALVTGLSQFHRAALGVIGPELTHSLGADAGLLGAANGAFFGALVLLQIPVGLALDRFGPRLTVTVLALPAALGALGQGLAPDATGFLAARFLLGIGCAASFMASVVLCARWFDGHGLTTAIGRCFAFSQLGLLIAGAPFAAAAELLGWRAAYGLSGVVTLVVTLACWPWIADHPPGHAGATRSRESLGEALLGQLTVWRTPGLLPVLAIHTVAYASMATVLAVWAGPYLAEIHGLAPPARGAVLLAMAGALIGGLLAVGPLAARIGSRPRTITWFASAAVCALALLALFPGAPLPLAALLLVLVCVTSVYSIVVVTEGRMLFPDHLIGRGATTVNLAQTFGSAALPAVTGMLFTVVAADWAWSVTFGTLALAVALGLAGYRLGRRARAGDRRPDLP